MDPVPQPLHDFVSAIASRDFDRLASTLAPDIAFRALAPGELVDTSGAQETASCFRRWFGDKSAIELRAVHAERLVDRWLVRYRFGLTRNGEPLEVEHAGVFDIDGGRLTQADVVCSGFRPLAAAPAQGGVHRFDAGDLGCGTGLPREFRVRLERIPVGDVLEVVTRDPSAREDLPSLARLLGHRVDAVEPGTGSTIVIRVERTR